MSATARTSGSTVARPSTTTPSSGLVAIDLTADPHGDAVVWRASEGGPTTSFTPTVRGRVVYAQVGEGVTALDACDGSLYWRAREGLGDVTPAVAGEGCYTAVAAVVALDAVTGEMRWRSEELLAAPSGLAVTGDAVVLACGDGGDGALYCFERDDGTTRWRYDAVGESYASAVVDGERAYAVGTDGGFHAVRLADGVAAWTYPLGDCHGACARPAVADGTVFAAERTGRTIHRMVTLDATSGDLRWARRVDGGDRAPVATDETVIFTTLTNDGYQLVVLDRTDGATRRRISVPDVLGPEVQPVVGDGVGYVVGEGREGPQSFLYAVG